MKWTGLEGQEQGKEGSRHKTGPDVWGPSDGGTALIERSGHEHGPSVGSGNPTEAQGRSRAQTSALDKKGACRQQYEGWMGHGALEAEADCREDMHEVSPCEVSIPSIVTTATS